jgi:cell division protein FtsA
MELYSPKLFIEINNTKFIFTVGDQKEHNSFKFIYDQAVAIRGVENNSVSDLESAYSLIKENIYLIEQELNYTFKEAVVILNAFNPVFINITGFKKLNGSQLVKENITYILNSLKSNINELEDKKIILHMFNSKYCLDNKKIKNLPVGLFGDFYSHELSFSLIDGNNYKNLNKIFDKSNLKINKFLLKSFIEGTVTSDTNPEVDTFFQIHLNNDTSKLFYFENDSLKYEQTFDFGLDIVIRDISKITSLRINTVKKIISCMKYDTCNSNEELIEKDLFGNENYRKIKKSLIYEIAKSRIKELSEIILTKNINLVFYNNLVKVIFFKINNRSHLKFFKEMYNLYFSMNSSFLVKFSEHITNENIINNAYKLAHFGWKQEAIPVVQAKKSLVAGIFDAIFD